MYAHMYKVNAWRSREGHDEPPAGRELANRDVGIVLYLVVRCARVHVQVKLSPLRRCIAARVP